MFDEPSEYYTLGYDLMGLRLNEAKKHIWIELKAKFGDQPEYGEIVAGALDAEYD